MKRRLLLAITGAAIVMSLAAIAWLFYVSVGAD